MIFYIHKFKYERDKSFTHNFRKYKLLVKAAFYYPFVFRRFPNPHLRTNAFMIWKEIFVTIRWKPLTSKFRAYQCESGRNSITNQVIKFGYDVLVVDKDGNSYEQNNWYDSKTFWAKEQENLMVSDNQTTKYSMANASEKNTYSHLAWGKHE
jgi:hypothetical protein